ncbi:MAG: hypothetical protein HF967_09930, partial [Methanosarcinales archaeon]|nr:hypothetical protein [Methanosarcinales archaeon]
MWTEIEQLDPANNVYDILQVPDSTIYAGTGEAGYIFKTYNNGISWDSLFRVPDWERIANVFFENAHLYATVDIPNRTFIIKYAANEQSLESFSELTGTTFSYSLIRTNGYWFVGTGDNPAHIYRGTTLGSPWSPHATLNDKQVLALLEAYDGTLYAGTGWNNGIVAKSVDNGNTWTETGDLPGAKSVFALVQGGDSAIYAGTDTSGIVYKTLDGGSTWIESGDLPLATKVRSLIYVPEYSMLVAGVESEDDTARAFISIDNGANWINFGAMPGASIPYCLLHTLGGSLLAGTDHNGAIFKATGFDSTGWLISSVHNTGTDNGSTQFGVMSWDAEDNSQDVIFRVRTFPGGLDSVVLDSLARDTLWLDSDTVINGQDISTINSVSDGDQFIQYRVDLRSQNPFITPILEEVRIEYTLDTIPPGILEARAFGSEYLIDTVVVTNDFVKLCFDEPTNKFNITSHNIDYVLSLRPHTHSWLDGDGNIGDAVWNDVGDTLKITLSFLGGTPTVIPGDIIVPSGDSLGDLWNPTISSVVITGTFAPFIDSIVAYENIDSIEGIDGDDYVTIYFSKRTNRPIIPDTLIDSILRVRKGDSIKTWLSGGGEIRAISWDTHGWALTCSLSVVGGVPTIAVGDILFPDSAGGIVIMDKFLRFPVISPATISGDFGDYGPIIDSAFASFDSIPVPPYYDDWVLLFFSEKTNAPVIDSSNIDSVLRLSGGHSWHIDTLYQVKTDWTGDTILIISWWPIYGIEEETDYRLPLTYHLFQNSPNPFVNRTIIRYAVGSDEGQKVKKSKSQKVSPPPADLSFILYPLSFSDPVAVGDTIYP